MQTGYKISGKTNRVVAAPSTKKSGCGCGSSNADCNCGVCEGLQSQSYPRYFAGQLLTETELNGTMAYVKAKNRLHNRYLHGWGVVCGLQVACHPCDGWVNVRSGYALDPCGNDILVPQDVEVNVLEMIRACRNAKQKRANCDPIHPNAKADCGDAEEYWCLTLAYDEQECRPVMPLKNSTGKSLCSCGCGGGSKCSCGGSAGANAVTGTRPGACEPTRLCETYTFDVVCSPDQCKAELPAFPIMPRLEDQPRDGKLALNKLSAPALALAVWLAQALKNADLSDTLFMRVATCLRELSKFLVAQMGLQATQAMVAVLVDPASAKKNLSSAITYASLTKMYRAVQNLYAQNPLNVRCAITNMLNYVEQPAPGANEPSDVYIPRAQASAYSLAALILQYALDCLCQNLMPPCPENPCDNRLILACMTIKNDKIVSICDFGCRRYAGSFPAWEYWLSALPIIPVIREFVKMMCCTDVLTLINPRSHYQRNSIRVMEARRAEGVDAPEAQPAVFNNRLMEFAQAVDPDGMLRKAVFANNFAEPKKLAQALMSRLGGMSLPNLSATAPVELAALRQMKTADAKAELKRRGVDVVARAVAANADPSFINMNAELVESGQKVVMFTRGGKTLGFAPYDADQQLAELRAEIEKLKARNK